MFRDRPLTWLFIIATVCVDLVLCIVDLSARNQMLDIATGYLLGQSAILGSWFANGSRHRLERAVMLVVGLLILSGIVCFTFGNTEFHLWGRALAALSFYAIAAAIGSGVCRIVIDYLSKRSRQATNCLNFPLIELFGWTLIVAVSAAIMRTSSFSVLANNKARLWCLALSALMVGVSWSVTHATKVSVVLRGGVIVVGYALVTLYLMDNVKESGLFTPLVISWIYVVAATITRLDAPSPARTEPQT